VGVLVTKPDETFIFRMAELIRSNPALGEKTAARIVGKQAGYQGKALDRFVERLRKKYRRLRKAGQLPTRAPIPHHLDATLTSIYTERPKQEALDQQRRLELKQQLQALGVQVPEARERQHEHYKALEMELDHMGTRMHTSLAYQLADQYATLEEARHAAQEFAQQKEWLEKVVPLYRELVYF